MTLASAATLAVLIRAVLDLAGAGAPAASRLQARLREVNADALTIADRARAEAGYRPPDLDQPYTTIFSLVQSTPDSQPLLLPPLSLTGEPSFPVTSVDPQGVRQSVASLRTGLAQDLAVLPPEPNALLFLLEKHGWAVSTGLPGLAFADLARLTAATAGAIAAGGERLQLVSADISGVQRFIYTISAKGALKSLRARSFFLELMADEVARRLLERLGLTRANLIYAGGGHLYLLAPATAEAGRALKSVQSELNGWLLNEVDGQLYLAMGSSEPFEPAQMAPGAKGVPDIWRQVAADLGRSKAARFRHEAQLTAFWKPKELKTATCEVCHQETDEPVPLDRPDGTETVPQACPICKRLYDLGGRLPGARYLVATEAGGADVVIAGTGYRVCDSEDAVRRIPARRAVMAINALEAETLAVGDDAFPVWLGTYHRKAADGRSMATFKELAELSAGKPLLGVLRMDVDHLGRLFSGGLPACYQDFGRTAGLSGALSRFFKLHLNSICAGNGSEGFQPLRLSPSRGPRPVVVVYAGGDDLFVVGAWDQTLELAFDIRSAFRLYTGGRLTVSAGMVAEDFHLPVHRLAQLAGEAEDAAKDNRDPADPKAGPRREKDSIAPLFAGVQQPNEEGRAQAAALFWDEALEIIRQFVEPALGALGDRDGPGTRLPRHLVYGLLELADYWVEHGPLYLHRLAYMLARVPEKLSKDPDWLKLRSYLMTHRREMAQLPPFVRWLDLIGRGGNERVQG